MGESFYFSNYLKCHSPHVQNQENFQCQTPSFVVLRLCMSIPSMKTIFREHYLGCKAKYLKKKKNYIFDCAFNFNSVSLFVH